MTADEATAEPVIIQESSDMWINPKFSNQPRAPRPPVEQGQRLAVFPRGDGVELRVGLEHHPGEPCVVFRVWRRGNDGQLRPTAKGGSLRLPELAEAISALKRAQALLERAGEADDRPETPTAPAAGAASDESPEDKP